MLGQLLADREQSQWVQVFEQATKLAAVCGPFAQDVQQLSRERPGELIDCWLQPDDGRVTLNLTKQGDLAAWQDALRDLNARTLDAATSLEDYQSPLEFSNPQWNRPVVKVAMRPYAAVVYQEKRATSPTLRKLMALGGWNSDLVQAPGWPSPAAAMLASGLLGAGAGYGAGMLAENLLPETWDRHKLRRTGAALGGLAGVVPAAMWGAVNIANDHKLTDAWPWEPTKQAMFGTNDPTDPDNMSPSPWGWQAPSGSPFANAQQPTINVQQFNQTVWHDPYVSQQLPPQTRALATGLIDGASHLAGGGRPATLITPWDVAKMTAGMGTGYASGALVGKALGALLGMPEDTQERLKQTGMWAGAVANVVPLAFGGQS